MNRLAAAVFLLALAAATLARAATGPLVLISLDGFRWDYCDLYPHETPHLRQMKREGVSARGLVPVFPSNTFPNHYTIVTGLYPAHHGLINNRMFDPERGEFFLYNTPKSASESRWWGGEPIWVTAIRQGRASACSYWAGSEAEIGGVRPTYWRRFDYFDVTFESRLEEVAGWYRRPPAERPAVMTFYLEETNGAGHAYGPTSVELRAAVALMDTSVGALRARLEREGIRANYVIVSDHGMTAVAPERTIVLDEYLDLTTVQLEDTGSVVTLRPLKGSVAELEPALAKVPHAKVYRAENLPARFHLMGNPRISPLWILPEEGWRVETKAILARPRRTGPLRGDHGYDPAFASMRGIFIAQGPAFKAGVQLPEVENIHIYNLLCAALDLKPATNDGDDRLVRAALR